MSNDVKISCSLCGGHISFPPEYLGQTIACPHCGGNIVLTAEDENAPKLVSAMQRPVSSSPNVPNKIPTQRRRLGLVVATVGLIVLITCSGFWIYTAYRASVDKAAQQELLRLAETAEAKKKADNIKAQKAREEEVERKEREARAAKEQEAKDRIAQMHKAEEEKLTAEIARLLPIIDNRFKDAVKTDKNMRWYGFYADQYFLFHYKTPVESYLPITPYRGDSSNILSLLVSANSTLNMHTPRYPKIVKAFGYSRQHELWLYQSVENYGYGNEGGYAVVYAFLPGDLDASTGKRYMENGVWKIDFKTKNNKRRILAVTAYFDESGRSITPQLNVTDQLTIESRIFSPLQNEAWVDSIMKNLGAVIYSYSETE